eukprot:Nk52_evm25s1992 gene=Nk52_evmTU25s1992
MQSFLHSIGESITPVLKNSKFRETGVLTPEEFVVAGDFLVYRCPTWTWESGEEKQRRPYLPPDKQFLTTRNVPCFKRVKQIYADSAERTVAGAVDENDDDGWIETYHTDEGATSGKTDELEEIVSEMSISKNVDIQNDEPEGNNEDSDAESIPDIDDFEDENLVEDDAGALVTAEPSSKKDDNILKTRTYDLSITYDKYYQTPRLWLFGYNENSEPLEVKQMFEDLSADHAKKTVTIEAHPHLPLNMASIHPCRHANVMKKILQNVESSGNNDFGVHMYLMVFLKFVQSVIPTIEYDFTREFSM